MHPGPADRITEHRNGERPVGISRPGAGVTGSRRRRATPPRPPILRAADPISRRAGPVPTGTTNMVIAAALATVAAASGNNGTRAGRQRRIGCSISHYDTAATATVAAHRAANSRESGPSGAFAVERQEDWPVPQVDAVGDGAQPHQRRQGQDAGDRAALFQRHRGDHQKRRRSPPRSADRGGIRRRFPLRSESRPPDPARPTSGRHPGDPPPPPGPDHAPASVQRRPIPHQQSRCRRADQQCLRTGIGAEIDPVARCVGGEDDRGRGRSQRPQRGNHEGGEPNPAHGGPPK